MKTLLKIAALSALVAAPTLSFAQQNQPLTRAQVIAELAQYEQAGYRPNNSYRNPESLQQATRIVAAENAGTNVAAK